MEIDNISQDGSAPDIPELNGRSRSEPVATGSNGKDTDEEIAAYKERARKRSEKLWKTKVGTPMPYEIKEKTDLCAKLKELINKCDRDSLPGKIPPFFLLLCCYSIQDELRKRGRSDRIFYDTEYDEFVEVLTNYLINNDLANHMTENENLERGAIWDKYLTDIEELSGKRPETMLFTLVYFNFKYFNKTEYEQHANVKFENYTFCKGKRRSRGRQKSWYLCLDGEKAISKRGEGEPAAEYFREVFRDYKNKCLGNPGPLYKQWKSPLPALNEKKDPSHWFLPDPLSEEQMKHMLARAKTIGWNKNMPKEVETRIQRSIKTVKLVYKMNYPKGGLAVIFNQEEFSMPEAATRSGTHADVLRLKHVLTKLGFTVRDHHDLTEREIRNKIRLLAREEFSDTNCLMVFVLTHGNSKGEVAAKDKFYDPAILWEPFAGNKIHSLANKPKILVLQACRGDFPESGCTTGKRKRSQSVELDSAIFSTRTSAKADFLLAFSCSPGYACLRDPNKGTWFIQAFCSVLEEYYDTEDLISMLHMVVDRVSDVEVYAPKNSKIHGKKQTPVLQSSLRRKIYFSSQGIVKTSEEESD